MPVIDLGGWPHVHVSVPAHRIIASMMYPADEAHRKTLNNTLTATAYLTEADNPAVWERPPEPAQVIALLGARHDEPSSREVSQRAHAAAQRGSVAGEALLLIASLAYHHGGGSVNKACYLLACAGKQGGYTSGLVHIRYTNAKALRNDAWIPYRSVAHFWAAYNLQVSFRIQKGGWGNHPMRYWWTHRDDFEEFVAFAEALRIWGERYIPHGRRKEEPTLPPQETWRIPDGTPLSTRYSVTPAPLPPEYTPYLQTYRA